MWKPTTGEPCAGKPPARFGGRGGESLPYPYQASLPERRALCFVQRSTPQGHFIHIKNENSSFGKTKFMFKCECPAWRWMRAFPVLLSVAGPRRNSLAGGEPD